MTPIPTLPQNVWDTLPVEVRALIEVLRLQIDSLQAEVRSLKVQIGSNSRNSSKPLPATRSTKNASHPGHPREKRGGQPGHKRAIRPLVPLDQLHGTITCMPDCCAGCGGTLEGSDPQPRSH